MRPLIAVMIGSIAVAAQSAPLQSFDDIRYWIGEGAHHAALAIDWDGATNDDEALVWGYRWEGEAVGETMLRDVIAADERLFAKLGANRLGVATLGLGYDRDDDGEFAIDDGTLFDADGIANASFSNADGATAIGGIDLYREGWNDAYWHYAVGASAAGGPVWATTGYGPSSQPLVDGAWHGFAIAVTLNADEFPQNLSAAEPATIAGDFNNDGRIDAADYTVWRDAEGPAIDYTLWAMAYGSDGAVSIPEPATLLLLLLPLLTNYLHLERA
ncbi:hypothetical protein Pla108_25960 [Botrimarina colliarenosi]|uniref:Dockerin domain-containing protein n=1 Tax=Botrimarina colliarenosi TaxID=2528001 RepID=A0A5C6A9X2_9BACT|nr:hypothetical protein [Botrimarina colliarenosi]TWT96822.1 hypothetical protein Pla108_25960 [Botrimarina colliarenosi]